MLPAAMGASGDWAESQVGRVVAGKWSLRRRLGVGGTAAVFEAVHSNGRHVAIKLLAPGRARSADLRNRFLKEGYAANRVGHPRVVRIEDDGVEADGSAYLVMELLRGEPLDQHAQRQGGTLPWPRVAQLGLDLLDVLNAAHRAGIVHRDIKPANLFWCETQELRVLDFGLARVDEPLDPSRTSSSLTRDGTLLGTPAFMAPEQARAAVGAIGAATDLWCVGATLFTLLTGRAVYQARTADETIALAATSSAPRLGPLVPEVPAEVVAVIERALEYDGSNRFPTALDMSRALRAAQIAAGDGRFATFATDATLREELATGGFAAPRRHPPRSTRALTWVGVGSLLFAAGWFASRRATTPSVEPPGEARSAPLPAHVASPGVEVSSVPQSAPSRIGIAPSSPAATATATAAATATNVSANPKRRAPTPAPSSVASGVPPRTVTELIQAPPF